MRPETKQVLDRLGSNFANTPDAQGKDDLKQITCALVELFVDEEPKLLDTELEPKLKALAFIKALLNLGLQAKEAMDQSEWVPEEKWEAEIPFMSKIKKFMHLQDVIMRYSK